MGSNGSGTPAERAVRHAYDAYGDALYAYVLRLVGGDRFKAEDVVQETMLRFWQKGLLLEDEAVRPWLFKVAHRVVIDAHRRTLVRPTEVHTEPAQDALGCEDDGIRRTMDALVLAEALSTLSASHRRVVVQVYLMGDTGLEAARDLNIPLGTVKSRSHYALRMLREAMVEAA
ncbi:sigma-70 family RNA polymerase sigma factor [Streptomyces sp. V4-01]|uniref:Sigma-70 family RNA polymerase sigma factor n=1 Tax=Actinacidiphila polyblastidii TaxID=3110430 RepID=A0ABU7PFA7_9ACTN|nr:sigma-70 family RNA polymerase sigma factor [Streptomyces sp. V4-01]